LCAGFSSATEGPLGYATDRTGVPWSLHPKKKAQNVQREKETPREGGEVDRFLRGREFLHHRVRQINLTLSLAFLAPQLIKAAVEGRLPRGINIERRRDPDPNWATQFQDLGLNPNCILQRTCASDKSKSGNPDKTRGLIIKTVDGNARRNPMVKIAADAANDMIPFAGEFGLTPVARSRLAAAIGGQLPSGKFVC
jgi:hypothetical protein